MISAIQKKLWYFISDIYKRHHSFCFATVLSLGLRGNDIELSLVEKPSLGENGDLSLTVTWPLSELGSGL